MDQNHELRRVGSRWLAPWGGVLLLAFGLALTVRASTDGVTISPAVKAEFQRFDADHNGVLDDDELALLILQDDPDWNNPVIQNLPGYRAAALAAAVTRAKDAFLFYKTPLPSNPAVLAVSLESLALYRKDHPAPKAGAAGTASTPPPPAVPKPAGDQTGAVATSAITIPKSLHLDKSSTSVPGEKLPAQFGWTAAKGSTPAYTVDGALSYSIPGEGAGFAWELDPTAEAHTSNVASAQQDSISVKLPTWFIWSSNYLSVGPDWERDMKLNTDTLGGQVLYSSNAAFLHAGIATSLNGGNFPVFLWRPYVGWEAGHAYDTHEAAAFRSTNTYDRALGKVHAELWLTPAIELAADYYHRADLTAPGLNYDYIEVSPVIYVGETTDGATGAKSKFSIGMTYKDGRTTPTFTPIDSLNAWFGVQF